MAIVIFAAGMPRSGSTWLYNVIRIMLTNSGKTVEAGFTGEVLALPPSTVEYEVVDFSFDSAGTRSSRFWIMIRDDDSAAPIQ